MTSSSSNMFFVLNAPINTPRTRGTERRSCPLRRLRTIRRPTLFSRPKFNQSRSPSHPRACAGGASASSSSEISTGRQQKPTQRRALRPPGVGPSAEFLGVSGTLATCSGLILLILLVSLGSAIPNLILTVPHLRLRLTAVVTFFYMLSMTQFDLRAIRKLYLTIGLSLVSRGIAIPILISGMLSLATLVKLPLASSSISSLVFLSSIPTMYSPAISTLSPHVYPALLAHLTIVSTIFAPVLALLSHYLSCFILKLIPYGLPIAAPIAPAALCPVPLFLVTTAPAVLALTIHRILPRKYGKLLAFISIPVAWMLSVPLLSTIVVAALSEPSTFGFGAFAILLFAVIISGALVARTLAEFLALERRVRRTMTLFFCTQGTIIAAASMPKSFPITPIAAAALLGLFASVVISRVWSRVIVRQS